MRGDKERHRERRETQRGCGLLGLNRSPGRDLGQPVLTEQSTGQGTCGTWAHRTLNTAGRASLVTVNFCNDSKCRGPGRKSAPAGVRFTDLSDRHEQGLRATWGQVWVPCHGQNRGQREMGADLGLRSPSHPQSGIGRGCGWKLEPQREEETRGDETRWCLQGCAPRKSGRGLGQVACRAQQRGARVGWGRAERIAARARVLLRSVSGPLCLPRCWGRNPGPCWAGPPRSRPTPRPPPLTRLG